MKTIKYIALLLLLILAATVSSPAFASMCRNYNSQRVCIISINRSAKNFWEYRAAVTVDGEKRPTEVYNCRQRVKVQKNGKIVPFGNKDAGKLICSFFKKS